MESTVLIPIFLVIIIPIYWLLRFNSAINVRSNFSEEVNNYLGDDNNPEELKLLVYHFFEESLDNFLPTKAWLYFIFFSNGKDSKHSIVKLKEKFGDDKAKQALKLIFKLMSVNIRLSPIQHIMLGLTVLLVSIVSVLSTIPSKAFDGIVAKTESALYRAVH